MSGGFFRVPYTGAAQPAANSTTVLFSSKTLNNGQLFSQFRRYVLSLANSQPGTVRAYGSKDGINFASKPFYEAPVGASSATRNNAVAIPTSPHRDVRVDFINGATVQDNTFYVAQALDDGDSEFGDAAFTGEMVSTTQLPSALGPRLSSGSVSMVPASDWLSPQLASALGPRTQAQSPSHTLSSDEPSRKAASLRGYLKGEGMPISAPNLAAKTYVVPAAWKGYHVRFQADGGDLYYQISTDAASPADVDVAARAAETGSGPYTLGPTANGKGCFKIPSGTFLDIPFPANAVTFALIASTSNVVARTHLAET